MKKKKYRVKPRFFVIISMIVIAFVVYDFLGKNKTKESPMQDKIMKNYLLIDQDRLYYVYESLVFKLPKDLYFTKRKSLKSMIDKKNYKEILSTSNYILPEKLEGYKKGKYKDLGDVDTVKIPLIKANDKMYIKSSTLNEIFVNDYYRINPEKKNVVIDVLNANGISGYAGRTGEKIKEKLSYEYTAANYDSISEYSYIIENRLSRRQLKRLVNSLDEKYIKIKTDSGVPTVSDAVIVLGTENVKDFSIKVISKDIDKSHYSKLKENGYKNLKRYKSELSIGEDEIRYNAEDYYTAYKISKLLKINNLVEDNSLINIIEIKIRGGN